MKRSDFESPKTLSVIECLIFVSIFVILFVFFYINYFGVISYSELQRARIYVNESLPSALETYKIDIGEYPTSNMGLEALLEAPVGLEHKWKGPYASGNFLDPWGNEYRYEYPSRHGDGTFDIWSLGPDKRENTDDDIVNWDFSSRPYYNYKSK